MSILPPTLYYGLPVKASMPSDAKATASPASVRFSGLGDQTHLAQKLEAAVTRFMSGALDTQALLAMKKGQSIDLIDLSIPNATLMSAYPNATVLARFSHPKQRLINDIQEQNKKAKPVDVQHPIDGEPDHSFETATFSLQLSQSPYILYNRLFVTGCNSSDTTDRTDYVFSYALPEIQSTDAQGIRERLQKDFGFFLIKPVAS